MGATNGDIPKWMLHNGNSSKWMIWGYPTCPHRTTGPRV